MLLNEETYNDKLAYNPSIFIDFDNKSLISHYAEPEAFEDFVPDGWNEKYQCFEDFIPCNLQYWISENGNNLIGE